MNAQLLVGLGLDIETLSSQRNILNVEEVFDISTHSNSIYEGLLAVNNSGGSNAASITTLSNVTVFACIRLSGSALITLNSTLSFTANKLLFLTGAFNSIVVKNTDQVSPMAIKVIYS